MAVAALQEKQSAADGNLASLVEAGAELAERLRRREAEVAEIAGKVGAFEATIAAAEQEIRGRVTALEREREAHSLKQEAHAETTRGLASHEEEARQLRHDIDTAQKRLSGLEVKRTELRMKIEHLKDNIWTAYHTEVETVVQELGQFEIDLDASKQRVAELREKIDQMGPINVDALQ